MIAFSRKTLNLHKNFHKTKNAVLTQIQINKIDLTIFLNKMRVLDYFSSSCYCNLTQKTIAHVIAHCQLYAKTRINLQDSHTNLVDIKFLMSIVESVKHLIK